LGISGEIFQQKKTLLHMDDRQFTTKKKKQKQKKKKKANAAPEWGSFVIG
jgi:hypothetical protein